MKSLIKSLNKNCCCEEGRLHNNKSEKEIAFDLNSKTFSIVDINKIRHQDKQDQIQLMTR